jgi:hypothetical protein
MANGREAGSALMLIVSALSFAQKVFVQGTSQDSELNSWAELAYTCGVKPVPRLATRHTKTLVCVILCAIGGKVVTARGDRH